MSHHKSLIHIQERLETSLSRLSITGDLSRSYTRTRSLFSWCHNDLCEAHNICHSLTLPHWTQANLVEGTNRAIKALVNIYLGRHHSDWDTYFRDALNVPNTVPHSSLGNLSPAFLNFCRELRPLNYRRGQINLPED